MPICGMEGMWIGRCGSEIDGWMGGVRLLDINLLQIISKKYLVVLENSCNFAPDFQEMGMHKWWA